MKPRTLLVVIIVIVAAAVCVRLGFWQLARLHEKQALNAAMRASLAHEPLPISVPLPRAEALRGRRVMLAGRYDETRQVLLRGRFEDGEPGVDVVTPLLVGDDSVAVLVDRGWLAAVDGRTARPQEHPEPGLRRVIGVAEPITPPTRVFAPRTIEADSVSLLSVDVLDLDTLKGRFPYALASFVVNELPGAGVPASPSRRAPEPLNESMHLGYAIQWFSFAFIIVVGSAALAWSRRKREG